MDDQSIKVDALVLSQSENRNFNILNQISPNIIYKLPSFIKL